MPLIPKPVHVPRKLALEGDDDDILLITETKSQARPLGFYV